MFRLFLLVVVVGSASDLRAHDVISTRITWSREISRIVYKRCISCHHADGPAFSLVSYDESRPWAKAIKEEVLSRRMPPWNAVKGFGELKDDVGLTQEQIEIIADWVEGGAPEGDPLLLPPKPDLAVKAKAATRAGGAVQVSGSLTLTQPLEFSGILPGRLSLGASVQVTAVRPDGIVEPLLWVINFNPEYNQPYYFANPIRLPAGSRIVVSSAQGASVALLRAAGRSGGP
jgi:hypothetical protein